ncbi:discoidin domain-containing protein [Marinimicrobium koreense]|uniref:discoidin domain-containing protein n=1 Tax=Marinimicrobium koreense TaxID=306545 RepID=UPI003F70706E
MNLRKQIMLMVREGLGIKKWRLTLLFFGFFSAFSMSSAAQTLPPISSYEPAINETIDASGFVHPGIGLTKEKLENARQQIWAEQEPWFSYYKDMVVSSAAARDVTSSNASSADPTVAASTVFDSQGQNSRFIADGLKVYTQALMYYITGDAVYRANALEILRIWQQMDPSQYEYFQDAHIHTGVPLNRMLTGAEILRYTSSPTAALEWTDDDTLYLTNNLINPVVETFQYTNDEFMNQHSYPLMGAMASYIFTGNRPRYEEAVEWMTVNVTAENQGFNGSIKRLFRLVEENAATGEVLGEPVVQHVEMGRDQAHGGGDLTNAAIIARMFLAQDTKVDPESGTVSESSDAVDIYEFLNDRILAAANYFWQYMLGYETEWVPTPFSIFPDGTVKGIYHDISEAYRGRMLTTNFWDLYYYYTYDRGVDLSVEAPHFYDAFTKRVPTIHYYQGNFQNTWNNVDAGGDFWLYMPPEAANEGDAYLPPAQEDESIVELEERYTRFDSHAQTVSEGDTSFIRLLATQEGSTIAVLNLSYSDRSGSLPIGIRVRTDGEAKLMISADQDQTPYHVLELPNTMGEWRYITYDMGINHVSYGQLGGTYSLGFFTAQGDGTSVDLDHLNVDAAEDLTTPEISNVSDQETVYSYVGGEVSLDFGATDASSSDVIQYSSLDSPSGSSLSPDTGVFNWSPTSVGARSFIVTASDGTSMDTKRVTIHVAEDRQGAVDMASDSYDDTRKYTTPSLESYLSVYQATLNGIGQDSDSVFSQRLSSLSEAVEALQLLTPTLGDGSIAFPGIVDSTFEESVSLLVDGNNDTFPVYTLAPYPNLFHILDFTENFKVSVDSIGVQSRMNFLDRGAGIAAFASNNGIDWTRITSSETPYSNEMGFIEVDSEFIDQKFRYLKLEMVNPQPDALRDQVLNIFEIGELRIFGERFETNNKIESVELDSGNADASGLISTGSTVRFVIDAVESISDVSVTIQGVSATVNSEDGIHWFAEATLASGARTGFVSVSVEYETQEGDITESSYVTDMYLVDTSDIIGNVLDAAHLIDPSTSYGRPDEMITYEQVSYLFDGDPSTQSDFRDGADGRGGHITFDFKVGGSVSLSSVDILARQDQYYSRINGAVVQGSHDNEVWTTISSPAELTDKWQTLTINTSEAFRYIRIYNSSAWFGNMAEVRFHGELTQPQDLISAISLRSDSADASGLVEFGDTVTLDVEAVEPVYGLEVTIQGNPATVESSDNLSWTAHAEIPRDVNKGDIGFTVDYFDDEGTVGQRRVSTTDGSSLYLIDGASLLNDVILSSELIDPSTTGGRPSESVTAQQVDYLFDGLPETSSDFRLGSNGSGAYIAFDFGEGNEVALTEVNILARQDSYFTRIEGAVVQGSPDNSTWVTLSSSASPTRDWQTLAVTDQAKYRYLRVYNPRSWFGNIAELRLHADQLPPVTQSDAPEGWQNSGVTVTLSSSDLHSEVTGTYYRVDGGPVQEGTSLTVNEEGSHTVSFWSQDAVGNIEAEQINEVKIDKSSPEVSFTSGDANVSSGDTLEDYQEVQVNASDDLSGVEHFSVKVDGKAISIGNGGLIDLAGSLGAREIKVTARDLAGNVLSESITVNVTTSVGSLQRVLKRFVENGDVGYHSGQRLLRWLEKVDAIHASRSEGRPGRWSKVEALDSISDFRSLVYLKIARLFVLTSPGISDRAETVLLTNIDYLISETGHSIGNKDRVGGESRFRFVM